MRNIDIAGAQHPHFIGAWMLDDLSICDDIITFFEGNVPLHTPGATAEGVNPAVKHSTDINIEPKDLQLPTHAALARYLAALHGCYRNYLEQWPFLGTMLGDVEIGDFNIQRYVAGGHFSMVHSERTTLSSSHRLLAWMTYLNDVDAGGATHFTHSGLDIQPERGKTLIWPAEWPHAHAGTPVAAGVKYVVTGWIHFPPAADGTTTGAR